MGKKIIALDDGHGMETGGKRTPIFPASSKYAGQFMHENEFNRHVVKLLSEHLLYNGFDILFTAPTDEDTPLKTRTDLANNKIKNSFNKPADILISVHANALTGTWGNAKGIETYVQKGYLNKSAGKLAAAVHKHLIEGTQLSNRGVKEGDLHMTRETSMDSILVECGFMDNLVEAELLMSEEYRGVCAKAIAKGVCEFFGVEFKKSSKIIETNPTKGDVKLVETPSVNKERYGTTDVRHVVFKKDTYTLKFVWNNGRNVSSLVKEHGADFGFNFPFFWQGNPVADTKIGKDIIANVAWNDSVNWKGVKYKDKTVTIGKVNLSEDVGEDGFMFKGTPLLIDKGNLCYAWSIDQDKTAPDIANTSAQRTILGLDVDGNLHLAIADGRTVYDKGLTIKEAALFMQSKGCIYAINGDGGGSTILADKNGGLNQAENTGSNERAVNHAVLVFMNKEVTEENPIVNGSDNVLEEWKKQLGLDALKYLEQIKQPNGDPIVSYDSWKDLLGEKVDNWLFFTMLKRILEFK